MAKTILQEETPVRRAEVLRGSCDKIVPFNYMKKFSTEELSEFKTTLSDVMIKLDQIENSLQKIKDEFKLQTKPLKSEVSELLCWIRDKAKSVNEDCFVIYTESMAEYYNAEGEQVFERPLEASERQKTIQMELRKTGTEKF
jgi:hypothetical protein